ncbi:phosphoesterase [Methanoculleus taiwanensis]|uniref:Phosphoesterase n=1 Tax=Methanoculleus taiwanensis TaxID=1550565 RepID=A0A498H254_9EURY|nr:DHH family phosphoesterase [Methanoculleus taiwanensis]RXE56170.1 phosphoesterase [Methanoculleus taiwanensis]
MTDTTDTIVYRLSANCDLEEVEEGKMYLGRVQGFANFGVFVQLNDRVKGLVHKSNIKADHSERDPIIVEVLQIRKNGNIDLEEVMPQVYRTESVTKAMPTIRLSDLGRKIGRTVMIEAEVAQIKQTSGPTIFTLVDESATENAAAFIEAGVRAYPEVQLGDIVGVVGEVMQRNNQLQIEVSSLSVLEPEDADRVRARIDQALDERAEPEDMPFLVESDVFERLRPAMRNVAKQIRKAVFTAQPIVLRHHADADGICAAVAVETAVTALIRESGGDFDAEYFLFKRSPSKAPFYEIEDITRDLDFALKDNIRYGQKMPMILLMDNGSTEEDVPAMKVTEIYGFPVVVVDHHHPDEIVDQYLIGHVNPYHVGGDFGITAGMLGTEIARMINPAVEEQIKHLPAIAAVGDRSEAPERARYLELAAPAYSEQHCKDIALALDYEQFWLRFNDGREIVKDIVNLSGNAERHMRFVNLLTAEANSAIEEQMEAVMPHVVSRVLPNGANLFMLDVEMYAHRFTFPPPGKTSGEVHDRLVREHPGEPVVTLGFGPDFAVLRSKGVMMNIPRMVRELRQEIVGGGVNGGGHLVVGSIKFVEGMRDAVLDGLIEKIGQAPI